MEDGELDDIQSEVSYAGTPGGTYDPAYEWPGTSCVGNDYDIVMSTEVAHQIPKRRGKGNQPCFRLVVLRSSILPKKQRIAALDSYNELQFGRDMAPIGSVTPRVRLKEMEVSKLHATAYWDGARKEWSVVDMGSKHGTFWKACTDATADSGVRLSPSRVASIPRRLRHLDKLRIGGTIFIVHLHDDQLPCEDCSPSQGGEIPLFPVLKDTPVKRTRDVAGLEPEDSEPSAYISKQERDPKKALTMLKRSLLTRHGVREQRSPARNLGESSSVPYLDRAARRRAQFPSSYPDAPGVVPTVWTDSATPSPRPNESPPDPVVSQSPEPLSETNIGHRLLMKQGWTPGMTLGEQVTGGNKERIALAEPLELRSSQGRAGLGLKQQPSGSSYLDYSSGNWMERQRQKRFDSHRYDASDQNK